MVVIFIIIKFIFLPNLNSESIRSFNREQLLSKSFISCSKRGFVVFVHSLIFNSSSFLHSLSKYFICFPIADKPGSLNGEKKKKIKKKIINKKTNKNKIKIKNKNKNKIKIKIKKNEINKR